MKNVFALILLCAAATAQFGGSRFPFNQRFGRFRQPGFFGGQNNRIPGGDGDIDDTLGGSQYHYSWRHAGFNTKWPYGGAVGYCRSLGGGWAPISINSANEDALVRKAIGSERVSYIWTGGQSFGRGWRWADGSGLNYRGWSHTGGSGRPQPDNREGNEGCLAVLNNFYRDGIRWHDVACHHEKPVICERG